MVDCPEKEEKASRQEAKMQSGQTRIIFFAPWRFRARHSLPMREQRAQFLQAGMGTDFIKALRNFIAGKLFLRDQIAHHVREIEGFACRVALERRRAKKTQSVVNVPHFGK